MPLKMLGAIEKAKEMDTQRKQLENNRIAINNFKIID